MSGSDRGTVGALLQDLVSGGCRRAALDFRGPPEKGAQFFCLLQSCNSLDLMALSDFPKVRNGRKVAFQHKSHVKQNPAYG